MDLKEKFTGKQLTIIIVAICAVFIFLGILTMVAGSDDESSSDNNRVVAVDEEDDGSDVSGRKYIFKNQKDRSEGSEEAMRSTGPPPGPRAPCWNAWKKSRSPPTG